MPTPEPAPVSTPPEPSPSAETGDPAPAPEPAPEVDPLDAVPAAADGYAWDLSDKGKSVWGEDVKADPAVKALSEHFQAQGWSQRRVNDVAEAMNVLADKGLIEPPFDPSAELAKLGENGAARVTEAENFVKAMQARGELTEEEFGEAMSLTPTAAGVSLLEKLRAGRKDPIVTDAGGPSAHAQPGDTPAQAEARALSRDERYGKDKAFTKEADAKWMTAFGG